MSPHKEKKQTPTPEKKLSEEGISKALDKKNYKDVIGYVFAPINQDELKYYCLIIFTVIGTTLTYFVPNIVSTICISLISIILCMFIATFIWMWTILPNYKRVEFIRRIQDVFKFGLQSYMEKNTDDQKKKLINHKF